MQKRKRENTVREAKGLSKIETENVNETEKSHNMQGNSKH